MPIESAGAPSVKENKRARDESDERIRDQKEQEQKLEEESLIDPMEVLGAAAAGLMAGGPLAALAGAAGSLAQQALEGTDFEPRRPGPTPQDEREARGREGDDPRERPELEPSPPPPPAVEEAPPDLSNLGARPRRRGLLPDDDLEFQRRRGLVPSL